MRPRWMLLLLLIEVLLLLLIEVLLLLLLIEVLLLLLLLLIVVMVLLLLLIEAGLQLTSSYIRHIMRGLLHVTHGVSRASTGILRGKGRGSGATRRRISCWRSTRGRG